MPLITIHKVHTEAECFMTGKKTEAVEFSAGDGGRVVVSLKEFTKLLRMELRKAKNPPAATESKRPGSGSDSA